MFYLGGAGGTRRPHNAFVAVETYMYNVGLICTTVGEGEGEEMTDTQEKKNTRTHTEKTKQNS